MKAVLLAQGICRPVTLSLIVSRTLPDKVSQTTLRNGIGMSKTGDCTFAACGDEYLRVGRTVDPN